MNTRISPTVNAPSLHLGHLFLTLVNKAEAAAAGGILRVRWDDAQSFWNNQFGPEKIADFKLSMKDGLDWAGIDAVYSSEEESGVFDDVRVREYIPADGGLSGIYHVPEVAGEPRPYPYAPHLTAAKVIADAHEGIGIVIRGTDLLSENALYAYFCEEFGYKVPRMVYLPKLKQVTNCGYYADHQDLADVSKSATTGTDWSISVLKKRFAPERLIQKLAECCLRDPDKGWLISNVRPCPSLYAHEWK